MIRWSALFLTSFLTAVFVQGLPHSARAADTCDIYPDVAGSIDSLAVTAAFGPVPAPRKALRFAYVTQTLDDPFWKKVIEGIKAEAARYGITVDITGNRDRSSGSEQLGLANAALASHPDAILISATNDSNLKPMLEAARQQNIPTIAVNAGALGSRVFIATAQPALAASAVEYLHELLPRGGAVAEILGLPESPYTINRDAGFRAEVAKYPNLVFVASDHADWDMAKGKTVMAALLRAHPEIVGVYANADVMALGALQALREAGRLGQVAVIGTDGIADAKKSIADHALRATAAQFPYDEGVLGVQAALRVLACQPVPPWIVSQQALIELQNLPDYADTGGGS